LREWTKARTALTDVAPRSGNGITKMLRRRPPWWKCYYSPSGQIPALSPLLLHVNTLEQLCLQEFNEYAFKRFRQKGKTESLKAFLDIFFLDENDDKDCDSLDTLDSSLPVGLVSLIELANESVSGG
jgi:hypothetical protein